MMKKRQSMHNVDCLLYFYKQNTAEYININSDIFRSWREAKRKLECRNLTFKVFTSLISEKRSSIENATLTITAAVLVKGSYSSINGINKIGKKPAREQRCLMDAH